MAASSNPYRPGFAERPALLAGRDDVLAAGAEALAVAVEDRHTPMPIFLVGPRGVGKTAVLNVISESAGERYGWPRLWVEAAPTKSLAAMISQRAEAVRRVVAETDRGGHRMKLSEAVLKAQVLGFGAELHLTGDPVAEAQDALGRLLNELAGRDSGLVLAVDEAHSARPEDFAALASTVQETIIESLPMMTVVAGLPTLRRRTSNSDQSLGYLERADWHEIGQLNVDDTCAALVGPAEQAGRPMSTAAATILAEASGGYPFAVQVFGKHAWRSAGEAPMITESHAREAVTPAQAELARNLYAARWGQSSPADRRYLHAVAEIDETGRPVTGRAVADRLGQTTNQLSVTRARLLNRGTLLADGDELQFMVPGFAAWARKQGAPERSRQRPRSGSDVRRGNER